MRQRVEGLFDKMQPGGRKARGRLTKGAIEIVLAVDDVPPQWPHVDVLTSGKLQVVVYLNGVKAATQLARYIGDPVAWAEEKYKADGNADPGESWLRQVSEISELAAVTAEIGTEHVLVTSAVRGPVRAGTVQAIGSRDAVHFGPQSTGVRYLLVFVVSASETDMDEQDVPLQRAGPDALAELGLVQQLRLAHVRKQMREPFFERRRKAMQAEFASERWPDRLSNRPMFSPRQWKQVVGEGEPAVWAAFRDELRCAAAAQRERLSTPRKPHPLVRIIPAAAQKEYLWTMGGVELRQLLLGTYKNGDAFAGWSHGAGEFTWTFEEAEVSRVDAGMATITPTDGQPPFIIGVGDVVEFGEKFACTFTVHEPIQKTLAYLTADGQIGYDTTKIECDKCGLALGENVAWYREVRDEVTKEKEPEEKEPEDWCEACFRSKTDRRHFVKQVRGTPRGGWVRPGTRARTSRKQEPGATPKVKKQIATKLCARPNAASPGGGRSR